MRLIKKGSPVRLAKVVALEALEQRRMFYGVTLVTHGYEPFWSDAPQWVSKMASAIATRAGAGSSIYKLKIVDSDGTASVQSFTRMFGDGPGSVASANAETVIILDWADASGVLGFSTPYSTTQIAGLVEPYLLNPIPTSNISAPLASGPIHLIGHSRGGSLVAALADDLGQDGIWVDQVTTLDPHPVESNNDYRMQLTSNVRYADNYFETVKGAVLSLGLITGETVPGAENVKLDSVGATHEGVHTWYHGTVATTDLSDGKDLIDPAWYTQSETAPRTNVGFNQSRLGGYPIPASKLGTDFGGSYARSSFLGSKGNPWPNLADLRVTNGTQFTSGQAINTSFQFSGTAVSSTITFYLDIDKNPTTVSRKLVEYTEPADVRVFNFTPNLDTTGVPSGTYYLCAVISDGSHSRVDYFDTPITFTSPAPPPPAYGYDLTTSLYYAPSTISPANRKNLLALSITNAGNLSVKGNVQVGVWASSDDKLDQSDLFVTSTIQSLNLKPGGTKYVTVKFDAPTNIPDGNYRLIAYVDSGQTMPELNEENNSSVATTLTVIQAPFVDVGVLISSAPSVIRNSRPSTVSVRVTNYGNTVANGMYSLAAFFSSSPQMTDAVQSGSLYRSLRINPGASVVLKIPFTVYSTGYGYLAATLGFSGTPDDGIKTNNTAFSSTAIRIA
jgi:hypothetical protein